MPKKEIIPDDLFSTGQDEDSESDGVLGVYLKAEEKALAQQLANKWKMSRHKLIQYGVRRFLKGVQEGKIKPPLKETIDTDSFDF